MMMVVVVVVFGLNGAKGPMRLSERLDRGSVQEKSCILDGLEIQLHHLRIGITK